MTDNKALKLDSILKELGSFAVAFSGGVDSSFLLYKAYKLIKSGVIAVTIRTAKTIGHVFSLFSSTVYNVFKRYT